jgi:uncharacterized repeat protein (TIGR03803 family)
MKLILREDWMTALSWQLRGVLLVGALHAPMLMAAAHAQSIATLYAFPKIKDGTHPGAALINVGGVFYGVTYGGGRGCARAGCGTVFSLTPAGIEKVVYSFKGGSDGWAPNSALVNLNGKLYGTTYIGGTNPDQIGTVFEVTLHGHETVLHSFQGGNDGSLPTGGLIEFENALYGTTPVGGVNGRGVVYKLSPKGAETIIYAFQGGKDGANPYAGLIAASGALYGTTQLGGTGPCLGENGEVIGCGTVFKITKDGVESVVYSFQGGTDGNYPVAALTNVAGLLYGTTEAGGSSANGGTAFALSLDGVETVLHAFQGHNDGSGPRVSLTRVKERLYGTTTTGGGNKCGGSGCGTLFSLTLGGAETIVYSFREGGLDGSVPGGLLNVEGTLYGTTFRGGGSLACQGGCGTVFQVLAGDQ